MQFTNYFFASLLALLGSVLGIILVRTAPEEQKPLENHFIIIRKFFLFLIFTFLIFYCFNSIFYLITIIFYALFVAFAEYRIHELKTKYLASYAVLGILFFLSSKNANLFTIESSLMLLYGIPTASLLYSRKNKNYPDIIFINLGFLITANLLFFV